MGKTDREIDGNIRIRARVLLKSFSLPSRYQPERILLRDLAEMTELGLVGVHHPEDVRIVERHAISIILYRQQERTNSRLAYRSSGDLDSLFLEMYSIC